MKIPLLSPRSDASERGLTSAITTKCSLGAHCAPIKNLGIAYHQYCSSSARLLYDGGGIDDLVLNLEMAVCDDGTWSATLPIIVVVGSSLYSLALTWKDQGLELLGSSLKTCPQLSNNTQSNYAVDDNVDIVVKFGLARKGNTG